MQTSNIFAKLLFKQWVVHNLSCNIIIFFTILLNSGTFSYRLSYVLLKTILSQIKVVIDKPISETVVVLFIIFL